MTDTTMLIIEAQVTAKFYRDALQRIVDRSNNGELGTSKVNDMRKIAERALEGRLWQPIGMDHD